MPWAVAAAVIGAAGAGYAANEQGKAAKEAANTGKDYQAKTAAQAEQWRAQDFAQNAPFTQTGYAALNAMNIMTGLDPVESSNPYVGGGLDDLDDLAGKKYDWNEGSTGDRLVRFREGERVRAHPTLHKNSFDSDQDFWNRFLTKGGLQEFHEEFGNEISRDDIGKRDAWVKDWFAQNVGKWKEKHHEPFFKKLVQGNGQYDEWQKLNSAQTAEEIDDAQGRTIVGGDYEFEADPGYAFRLAEGEGALNRQMSSQGLTGSGAALKAATEYGQGSASNEFGKVYDRLAVLAGYGPTGVSGANSPALDSMQANAYSNAGAYDASGIIASSNSTANGINEITKALGAGFKGFGNWFSGGADSGWSSPEKPVAGVAVNGKKYWGATPNG